MIRRKAVRSLTVIAVVFSTAVVAIAVRYPAAAAVVMVAWFAVVVLVGLAFVVIRRSLDVGRDENSGEPS